MRVLVFGASITQGFWDSKGGWVSRLRNYYDEQTISEQDYETIPFIFNLGISGDRTVDVLNRFEAETRARLNDSGIAFIISVGINDTQFKDNEYRTDIKDYAKDLERIYKLAKTFSDKILFVGLTPVDDSRSFPFQWADAAISNERIKLFDDTLEEFCNENSVRYVKVFEKFREEFTNPERILELLPDALHPSDAGHEILFNLIKPAVVEMLEND